MAINHILGVRKVVTNMKLQGARNGARVSRIVKKAGLILQATSQKLVPIDTANTKNSAFTRAEGQGFRTKVFVGYTSEYAFFLHENVEMKWAGHARTGKHVDGSPKKGTYWSPTGAQSKFLETPARNLKDFPSFRKMVKMEALKKV